MYYIPSTDADSLVQIDLSDDAIVAQLFANHAWEELLEPLEVVTGEVLGGWWAGVEAENT